MYPHGVSYSYPRSCAPLFVSRQSYTAPGIVTEYRITAPLADPAYQHQITLNSGEDYLSSSVADLLYTYFGTGTAPGRVVRVKF